MSMADMCVRAAVGVRDTAQCNRFDGGLNLNEKGQEMLERAWSRSRPDCKCACPRGAQSMDTVVCHLLNLQPNVPNVGLGLQIMTCLFFFQENGEMHARVLMAHTELEHTLLMA